MNIKNGIYSWEEMEMNDELKPASTKAQKCDCYIARACPLNSLCQHYERGKAG